MKIEYESTIKTVSTTFMMHTEKYTMKENKTLIRYVYRM
jgi:hypothetical protein